MSVETEPRDLFFVAGKLFLRDGDKLLITHDVFGAWDLPGGRIQKDEFGVPLPKVIERKIHEELGENIQYEIGQPLVHFQVERLENSSQKTVRIFAVGYAATYLGGEIQLGDHHDKMELVDVNTFKPEDYFVGGWLTGLQEYLKKVRSNL